MIENKTENKTVETIEKKDEGFTSFYDVKMQGILTDYEIKEDESVQLLFNEKVQLEDNMGMKFVQHSVRLRMSRQILKSELESLLNTTIEVNDVTEMHSYKKIEEGVYDFSKIEKTTFSATTFKKITDKVEGDFKLFRMFEIAKIANVAPLTDWNQKTRKNTVKKGECLVQYYVKNGNKNTLHNIKVISLDYKNGLSLVGKKIKVLDYREGKTPSCTRIERL